MPHAVTTSVPKRSVRASFSPAPAIARSKAGCSTPSRNLLVLAEIRTPPGRRRPRIHDMRHTFAVTSLIRWYQDGVDVPAHLPVLSTYLGHASPEATYWYLQAAPQLLALAAQRLEDSN